ncbi:hypothetical protein V5O48_019676, partial [Marasmius crinis-equi]
ASEPSSQQLENYYPSVLPVLEDHPGTDIEAAFDKVKTLGLQEFDIFGIETFGDWLKHVDRMIKWRPSENKGGSYVYMSICLFYIIVDEIRTDST